MYRLDAGDVAAAARCGRTCGASSSARGGSAATASCSELRLRRWAHSARVPRALLHQEPPLLDDVHGAAPGAPRAPAAPRAGELHGRAPRSGAGSYSGLGLPDARRRLARRVGTQARARGSGAWRAKSFAPVDGESRRRETVMGVSRMARGRAVRDGAGGRGSGRAVDGHDPALLPRREDPGPADAGADPAGALPVERGRGGVQRDRRPGRRARRAGSGRTAWEGRRRERAARTDLPHGRTGCGRSGSATRWAGGRSGRGSGPR